ncbi:glycosyltransferase [Ferribacterium limneticum]|uniref:glycosyltransferase n=1 Tax=Ferribacterium limneticum TaxID=76259 RepID=UPI001CFB6BD4|nr:glycosyltransferase [Ferribacterium limneticum]UCV19779.1 glycosyltransferase [Ferribacterium limneticum]
MNKSDSDMRINTQEQFPGGVLALPYPPTEEEIIERWTGSNECLVSICMLTYNHAKFLRSALNGILSQDTDFGFEILIHDDASTDETQEIIREYHQRYPHIIKPILQSINQFSQGVRPSVEFNYPRANAEYVAWCEGDDCWVDNQKLRIQITEMSNNPNIDLSFHQAVKIDYFKPDTPPSTIGNYSENDAVIPFIDIIHRRHGAIPTASCIVRQRAKHEFLEFLKNRDYLTVGDLYLQLFGSVRRGALYFAIPMSVYRVNTEFSWTRSITTNPDRKSEHEVAMIQSYIELDSITEKKITDEFKKLIIQRIFWLFDNERVSQESIDKFLLHGLKRIYETLQDININQVNDIQKTPRKYVIYGAGSGCGLIMRTLKCEDVVSIIDRDGGKVGETMYGIPVDSIQNMATYNNNTLIISTFAQDELMVAHLIKKYGFNPSEVIYFYREMINQIKLENILPVTKTSLKIFKKEKKVATTGILMTASKSTCASSDVNLYVEFMSELKQNLKEINYGWSKHKDLSCDWILERIHAGVGVDVGGTTYLVKKLQDRPDCKITYFDYFPARDKSIKRFIATEMSEFGNRFSMNSLDFIITRHTLEHSLNPLFQLWQFNRALKENGTLIVVVPQHTKTWVWLYTHFNCLPLENWLMLFKRAGFSIEESDAGTWKPDDPEYIEYRFVLKVARRGLDLIDE